MTSSTLIEIVFKGVSSEIKSGFLSNLLFEAKEVRFNDPEVSISYEFDNVIRIFQTNSYVDLVITTDQLDINGRIIKNVFINIGKNNDEFELLFYFDVKDLGGISDKLSVEHLKTWACDFRDEYNFNSCIGQIDNAGVGEYYFNGKGMGPLYDLLSN